MQELRYILVALGGIAIAALLIHGLWSNRKNRQAPIKEKPLGRMESKSRDRDNDAFDSDGIGQVRVVSGGRRAEPKLHLDEPRQPEVSRRAPAPAFDDEDDDADLPPPVVRKPAARPVPPPPSMKKTRRSSRSRLPQPSRKCLPRRCASPLRSFAVPRSTVPVPSASRCCNRWTKSRWSSPPTRPHPLSVPASRRRSPHPNTRRSPVMQPPSLPTRSPSMKSRYVPRRSRRSGRMSMSST